MLLVSQVTSALSLSGLAGSWALAALLLMTVPASLILTLEVVPYLGVLYVEGVPSWSVPGLLVGEARVLGACGMGEARMLGACGMGEARVLGACGMGEARVLGVVRFGPSVRDN
ncbi:unnamed protein product [Lupinus luteus]|uniref:Secreted protein n=1 Tax=Lupinus luteus TaxID=3873 RepID=A0AAV1WWW4_LUPLU